MEYFETQSERTDLPVAVVPSNFAAMVEPMRRASAALKDIARVRLYSDMNTDPETVVRRLAGAQLAIIFGIHFDEALLRQVADSVRCLVFGGTGVASYVNLPLARRLGIEVRNIVHYGDASVAEHTIALMFEVARRIGVQDASMKRGEWSGIEGIDLHGKRLGLAGFGGIAQAVARMAAAIGMKVSVWAREGHRGSIEKAEYVFVPTLDELFSQSEVMSLHVGLNPSSARMITAHHLAQMPTGAFFINTARSELVEEGALEAALASGRISAGIDVYDDEPLPASSPLRTFDNAVLTPHVAWFADAAVDNIVEQVCEGVADYLRGGVQNVMN